MPDRECGRVWWCATPTLPEYRAVVWRVTRWSCIPTTSRGSMNSTVHRKTRLRRSVVEGHPGPKVSASGRRQTRSSTGQGRSPLPHLRRPPPA
jgi:hypothetical protein